MKKHIKIKLFLFVMGFIASIGAWADRSWNYTYNTQGLIESSDGPRTDVSDVTAYTYDAAGNLQTVTNALNQVTTLQNYNAAGLPQTIVDINGTLTLLEYNWRGKVTKRTLQSTQGDAVTLFEYDPVGLLTKITLPDNTFLSYEHDDARRLIATVNNAGERLEYTKDAMGNVILEQIKDSAGTLLKTQSRVFDEMGRMIQSMGASAQTTAYSYDNNSNLTNTTNPLGNSATQSFDALQRLISQVDEKLGETQYAYDAQDNLTSVTDPRGINTTYLYDELGNLIQQSSPETGITLYSHDAAGNIISKTDARNVVTQYSYDALNRLLQVSYPANPSENITYSYDDASAGNKGLGRLTRIVDPSGTTQYRYDDRGNVVQDSKTLDSHTYTTDYGYDLADKLLSITYPSGQIVSYGYNSLGQVNRIDTQASATATQQTIMQNVEYLPFGGISVLTYGNGISYNLLHDQDYLITDLTSTAIDRTYQYDLTSNITNITDNQNSQRSEGFVYDELSRLIENQASDGTLTFDYDPVGNRTLLTTPNDQTTYSYPLDSNRLASNSWWNYEYDAVGNTTRQYDADGNQLVFAYNHRNRLSAVTKDSVTSTKVKGKWVYTTVSTQTNYEYNALGQRVIKSSDSADVYYLFNLQGQVIAEADSLGNIQTEYVYLDGQPLAQISTNEITTGGTLNLTLDNTVSSTTGNWTLKSNRKALNSDYLQASGGTNSTATWQPTLAAGSYAVSARWISNRSNSTQVPYTIYHNGQTDTVYVDQTANNGKWIQLGTFDFDGSGVESIQVSDSNGQTSVDGIQLLEQSVTQLETQLQYIHNDHLGTPQRMTNASGDVVWEALYEPFGAAIVNEDVDGDGQSVALNLRFPGQYFDVETGLHYNYFRDYDPSTGRYIQSDPIGLDGGINTYAYVANSPINSVDPMGLWSISLRGTGTFHEGTLGGEASSGPAIGTDENGELQVCWQTSVCANTGLGIAGGAGAELSCSSDGDLSEGDSTQGGLFGQVGNGKVSVVTDGNSTTTNFSLLPAGGGSAGGATICETKTVCW